MEGIVSEIDYALTALGFKICLVNDIALGDFPRPDFGAGGVGLGLVICRIGEVVADYR